MPKADTRKLRFTGEPDALKGACPVREGAVGNLRQPVVPVVRRHESQQGAGRLLHKIGTPAWCRVALLLGVVDFDLECGDCHRFGMFFLLEPGLSCPRPSRPTPEKNPKAVTITALQTEGVLRPGADREDLPCRSNNSWF